MLVEVNDVGRWHEDMIQKIENVIKEKYKDEYEILAYYRGKIQLPDLGEKLTGAKILYNPDLVVKDRNGNVCLIVEVEEGTDPTVEIKVKPILADFCIGLMVDRGTQKGVKPKIRFVVRGDISSGKLNAILERAKFIQQYAKHVEGPVVIRPSEISESYDPFK